MDDIEALEAALQQRAVELTICVDGETYREFVPIEAGFPTMKADEDHAVMLLATQVGGIALTLLAKHFAPGLLEEQIAELQRQEPNE